MQTDEKRTFKNQLYEQFARLGKALASPHRLELLDVLAQCERTVEALALETGMSVANASQHLQVLRAAHLVEVRREGVSMYYRLTDENVFRMWQALRTVGEAQGLPHPEDAFVSQSVVHRDALAADLDQVGGTQHLQVL